jgi:hypothetical protein
VPPPLPMLTPSLCEVVLYALGSVAHFLDSQLQTCILYTLNIPEPIRPNILSSSYTFVASLCPALELLKSRCCCPSLTTMHLVFPTLLLVAHCAHASIDIFYFANNKGNITLPRLCGNMSYPCEAPNMCTLDSVTQKQYCCGPGKENGICWTRSSNCEGASVKEPSSSQIGCQNLNVNYCCVAGQEVCSKNVSRYFLCTRSR